MRFAFETSEELSLLAQSLLRVAEELLKNVSVTQQASVLKSGDNLAASAFAEGIYVLKEGSLTVSFNGRELYWLEEGDIYIAHQIPELAYSIESEFAVCYDFYQIDNLFKNNKTVLDLCHFIALQQALIAQVISTLHKGERKTNPSIKSLKAGEVIVNEGEISDQVFTLLEGHAQVTAAGEIVGEVKVDELVGVIGALCGIPRIATVRVTVDSLVMSLGKEDFVDLLSLRPHTVIKLIEDFARIISTSNQKLVELKSKSKIERRCSRV